MSNLTSSQKNDVLTYIYINHPEEEHVDHLCHIKKKDLLNRTGLSNGEVRESLAELQSKGLLLLKSENSLVFDFVPFQELYDFIRSGGF